MLLDPENEVHMNLWSSTHHEQHIRVASCRSRFKSQWETPTSTNPHGTKTIGQIKLTIGSINYLGCLTKRVKFHICKHSGVIWAMGWNIHYLDLIYFSPTFFSTRTGRAARQIAVPSDPIHVFPCKEVSFGGLVDTLPICGILGAKPPIWGPEIGNPIVKKTVNNSKTVRDREKVTIYHL